MQIKSYTDLEQSRKLAKILPLESADMFFSGCAYPKEVHFPTFSKTSVKDNIPCWSLAALINVIPYGCLTIHVQKKYRVIYNPNLITEGDYDNPVDAAYEMVLKLKEKNLL